MTRPATAILAAVTSIRMQEATSEAAKRIAKIGLDQWFIYDDPNEPDEKVARIKLILNWEETEQLLLTNHNRRKVVPFSYGEMINQIWQSIKSSKSL